MLEQGYVWKAKRPAPWMPGEGRRSRYLASVVLAGAGFLGLWHAVCTVARIPPYVIPTPVQVGRALAAGLLQPVSSRAGFYLHAWVTLQETLIGFAVGSLAGFLIAVAMSYLPWMRAVVMPYIVAVQSLPKSAVAPLFILWFGYGIESKVALVILLTFFPVLVNSLAGLVLVEEARRDLFRVMRARWWQEFLWLRLPAAWPYVFAGLELGAVFGLIGATVGEFVGGELGLGILVLQRQAALDTAGLFAALVVLGILGVALQQAVQWVRSRVVFWERS